jgi:two-component system nitrate/nitrite response regulator NarL
MLPRGAKRANTFSLQEVRGGLVKILLAAPTGWATDALCGLFSKIGGDHDVRVIPDPRSLGSVNPPPDLLLLDIDASADDAPSIVAAASRRYPGSRIVVMGTSLDNDFVESVLEAGALGYLPKSFSETVILGVLRLILGRTGSAEEGEQPGEDAGTTSSVSLPPTPPEADSAEAGLDLGLTDRQIDVLALASEGKSNQSIAKQLGIEEGTVKLHMTAIFKTLKVRNRSEAVLLASRFKSINFRQIKEAEGGRLDLDWLLAHMTHEHLAADTTLFKQGDAGGELYYLQRGSIRLPEIGVELTSGAMFGEIGIFSPTHKRTSSAICVTNVEIFRLTSDQVKRLYLLNPQFALYIVHLIAKRLMADQTRMV